MGAEGVKMSICPVQVCLELSIFIIQLIFSRWSLLVSQHCTVLRHFKLRHFLLWCLWFIHCQSTKHWDYCNTADTFWAVFWILGLKTGTKDHFFWIILESFTVYKMYYLLIHVASRVRRKARWKYTWHKMTKAPIVDPQY